MLDRRVQIQFTSTQILEQVVGGDDEHCSAQVHFLIHFPVGCPRGVVATVKQTPGSVYRDAALEVSLDGLSDEDIERAGGYQQLAEAVRHFYTRHIVVMG